MAEAARTVASRASVAAFLRKVADEDRRRDCEVLAEMMAEATGAPPVLWGTAIVGFGAYRCASASGRTGEAPMIGFSPHKNEIAIYVMPSLEGHAPLLARLGKHRAGKARLSVKRLDDVDLKVLRRIVRESVAAMAPRRSDK